MKSGAGRWLLASILLLAGCQNNRPPEMTQLDPVLAGEIRALGAKNWIVIADQSFPLHARRGVRTLLVNKEIPEGLSGVLNVIDSQQHVDPLIYRAREASIVENDTAPGYDPYRRQITAALQGRRISDFKYRHLSVMLEDDSKSFAVLVIKTTTALPYSSIFIELDNGYWDQRSEEELRARIESNSI